MKTIYCDMDGVIADFNSRYRQMFGILPLEARDKKEGLFSKQWNTFVASRQFTTLDKMPDADELINFLKSVNEMKNYRVAILSSTGGFDRHNTIQIQKRIWLESKAAADWPMVFVPGRRFKKGYADKYSLLIDDTYDVIESFDKAGGKAVWHKDAASTIEQVKQWMS